MTAYLVISLPKIPYTQRIYIYIILASPTYIHTVYDRMTGDFPAKSNVYTAYIYGSGQPTYFPPNRSLPPPTFLAGLMGWYVPQAAAATPTSKACASTVSRVTVMGV